MLIPEKRRKAIGHARLTAFYDLLRQQGLEPIQAELGGPHEIEALVPRWRGKVDRLLIGGGDGTMNAAARAILDSGLPFGILPLGTANDLARTLAIPTALAEAGRVAARGRIKAIDLGEVNGKLFFNVASIGLPVAVAEAMDEGEKARWGVAGYLLAFRRAWRSTRAFRVRIDCDGRQVSVRSIMVAVGNGRYHGGGLTVAEDAALDDGRLDLYSLRPQTLLDLALMLPALLRGRQRAFRTVLQLQGQRIELRTRRAKKINVDGEVVSRTPAVFRVLPRAVRVIVPR